MRKSLNSTALMLLLVALCGAGCKKEEAPPPPPAKPRPAPLPKPAPLQAQLSSATNTGASLDFSKKTDPFKSQAPVVAKPQPGSQGTGGRGGVSAPSGDVLPIQSFEVTKFKVAGIIAGLRENQALVIDPNGKGYVVRAGMAIGNANGRISRITSSSVEVVERYRDGGGRTKSRTIVLTLPKKR
ncbi:Type IV pilus biogenesis protein PilP [Citrifermentans bremense]|uniref:Type IV pilus biogenesis protein PilP n=1 Tax=Citrifermentans bremense TaxID=60035 RepID=A0A6S6M8T5_9BACT|nr:pilus assembly protein PilP [Citrifermentans bremense]BCG47845.1 Type IV pilus biogenesis protein PilP [Citrifermentans bremense]